MKTTLTFEATEEDTLHHIKVVLKAQDLILALWDIDQELRSKIKYQDKNYLEEARELVWEVLNQYNIDFDELTY